MSTAVCPSTPSGVWSDRRSIRRRGSAVVPVDPTASLGKPSFVPALAPTHSPGLAAVTRSRTRRTTSPIVWIHGSARSIQDTSRAMLVR